MYTCYRSYCGSVHAGRGVDIASDLAKRFDAKLTLIHVLTHSGGYSVPEELASYAKIEHILITEQDLIQSAGQEILANAKKQARV